jgi:hypothetical protein
MSRRAAVLMLLAAPAFAAPKPALRPAFQTSDRCVACHNDLKTSSGEDVSIGFEWRASMMANSSRDPYWRAGVRRETIDHPEAAAHIEDECSICHMPIARYEATFQGGTGKVFAHIPFADDPKQGKQAADGVSCSVCHQISPEKLGTKETFNGRFVIASPASPDSRPEYGPYAVDRGHARIMRTSTGGYNPTEKSEHIRKSEMCATCHTLYTTALGPGGKPAGSLPEQMPYQEWLHSAYRTEQTCQDCHMPAIPEPVAITRVFGVPREGVKRHSFVGANFFMQSLLNKFRDELEVEALPREMAGAAAYTLEYLKERAARVTIGNARVEGRRLLAEVRVENLGGHKLPTAYPSRRAWLHVTVRDSGGRVVFESGALRPDGSIAGNDNDADPQRFEPHYAEIRDAAQVQVYENIMGDPRGRLTTGLLSASRYLKDNRLLPRGFDKRSASADIAVIGEALQDADFGSAGDRVRYSVALAETQGPVTVEAELMYQPVGYRWAHNLEPYATKAEEPRRFLRYYESMSASSSTVLARTSAATR